MVLLPSGATRVSRPATISTTRIEPSASATGPSGKRRPFAISRSSIMAVSLADNGWERALGMLYLYVAARGPRARLQGAPRVQQVPDPALRGVVQLPLR